MRSGLFTPADGAPSSPLWLTTKADWETVHARLAATLGAVATTFVETCGFEPRPGAFLLLPTADGTVGGALFGIDEADARRNDAFLSAKLADLLPEGRYHFANLDSGSACARLVALGFALQAYRFTRYRDSKDRGVRLVPPPGIDTADLDRTIEGVFLARDLINTPANDMGPEDLEAAARHLARRHGAAVRSIVGDDLLTENFPLIHAVGRASTSAPRLIDMTWGDADAPKVTLVGKGVCFDTGGLDIKPDNAMLLMKKDMAGAATVLALAHMIMDRKLKLRLRVLIPAVENSIAGNAFRPLDIYRSRKGLSVEIGNTDAEGRLVLADALTLADTESPDLLVNMGTLTGAARVALGPELPPFYTDDDALAADLARHGMAENDPLWRLPLWRPYETMLDSAMADTNNVGQGGFAGSITCALFLARFVEQARAFVHFDIYGWVPKARPGRLEGGECQAARALYALLCARYG